MQVKSPLKPAHARKGEQFAERGGILRCLPFHQFRWQEHGFGSREANPSANVTLRQVHSSEVRVADGLGDREAEGDALITSRIGLAIGVRTADCIPILLLDSRTHAVAAIHAGWRGTAAQIAERAVVRLAEQYGSKPEELHAAIGPGIRSCCYEVSDDVISQFERWPRAFRRGDADEGGKPHLDLALVNRLQLTGAGLHESRVFDCGLCTRCELQRFFSYRGEPQNSGRMLAAVVRTA